MNKKLNQSIERKVFVKVLLVLKGLVAEGGLEAFVVKASLKGPCEDLHLQAVVLKDVVHKLLLIDLLFKALRFEGLSQATCAKLKLVKVKAAIKVLALQALLLEVLSQASCAKLKLIQVKAVQCKDMLEAVCCKAMLWKAPP